MQSELELPWTGERLVTTHVGDTAVEHLHRYAFAREYARDKDVLDIACGEGYGAYLLSDVARSVVGVDVAEEVVAHARLKYGKGDKVSFRAGTCSDIPLGDASVDLVVSFETLEHHDEHERMLREVRRILRPGGMLVISTPDRLHCTILPKNYNAYHFKELFKDEFKLLLDQFFANVYLFEQKVCHGSVITPGAGQVIDEFRHYQGDFRRLFHTRGIAGPLFNLAVATDSEAVVALKVTLFEGMEIPTEVEKHLDEARRSNSALVATNVERDAHISWLDRHHNDVVADYQSKLSELETNLLAQKARETESLRKDLELRCKELELLHVRECADLAEQARESESSRKDLELRYKEIELRHARECADLAEQARESESLRKDLELRCKEIESRHKDLELREKEIELRDKEIESRRKDLELRDKDLELRDMDLELRDKDLELRDKEIELRDKDVELRHARECADLRASFSQDYVTLLGKWESVSAAFSTTESNQSQEIQSLRNELQAITSSRAWRTAHRLRRGLARIRNLRVFNPRPLVLQRESG